MRSRGGAFGSSGPQICLCVPFVYSSRRACLVRMSPGVAPPSKFFRGIVDHVSGCGVAACIAPTPTECNWIIAAEFIQQGRLSSTNFFQTAFFTFTLLSHSIAGSLMGFEAWWVVYTCLRGTYRYISFRRKRKSLKLEWSGIRSVAVLRALALAIELSMLQCLLWVRHVPFTSYSYLLTRPVSLTGGSSHAGHLLLFPLRREKYPTSFAGRANPDSRIPRIPGRQYSLLSSYSIQLMTSLGVASEHYHYPSRASSLSPRAFRSTNHPRCSSVCPREFKDH